MKRPVHAHAVFDVARTNDNFGAIVDRPQKQRDRLRIMRKISIHRDNHICVAVKNKFERVTIGSAEALFAWSMKHSNMTNLFGRLLGLLTSAIGAVVVDDE